MAIECTTKAPHPKPLKSCVIEKLELEKSARRDFHRGVFTASSETECETKDRIEGVGGKNRRSEFLLFPFASTHVPSDFMTSSLPTDTRRGLTLFFITLPSLRPIFELWGDCFFLVLFKSLQPSC